MYAREGPIISEPQYICDVCGKKKPVSQMAGKCVKCGKFVCSACSEMKHDKIYCPDCVPSCFIATAAYGDPFCNEISVLRNFRDSELESHVFGKQIVNFYYDVSPTIAKVIEHSRNMKAFIRHFLKPIIQTLKKRGY